MWIYITDCLVIKKSIWICISFTFC